MFSGKTYGLIEGKADAELMVAVKTLKEGSSTETKEDFFQEVALMSVLHHENIVELLAVSTDEEPYGMIFEFMDLGDLNQYLRKAGPFFEGEEKEKGLIEFGVYTCYHKEITADTLSRDLAFFYVLTTKRVKHLLLVTQ